MQRNEGVLTRVWVQHGRYFGRIACPAASIPAAGQILAVAPHDGPSLARPVMVSPAEIESGGFITTPGLPAHWQPGERLSLRGPSGNGFNVPATARHLALACLGEDAACLMPLAAAGLSSGKAVTLFAGGHSLPDALPYPLALEVLSLNDLASALSWADYLAIDAPLPRINTLRQALGLQPGAYPAPPTQVWIEAAFPCAGVAECGACAVRTRQGWKLACHDGPVFDFKELRLEDDPR